MTVSFLEENVFYQHIKDQIAKLEQEDVIIPMVTVSIEPGSGGSEVARGIADRFGFEFINREIIKEIAESVHTNPKVIEGIEKERLTGLSDFIASLLREKYLWPGMYFEHLNKIIAAMGDRGRAVIVGRGANFILPPEKRLSLRVIAPLAMRIRYVANAFDVSEAEARTRIIQREERRSVFIKKSFQADIADPHHYDLVINTGNISIEKAVNSVSVLWMQKYAA
jgi:cytidylate kinase